MEESKNVRDLKTWAQVKDEVFGMIGEPKRDELEKEVAIFRERLLKRKAKNKHLAE
ncbi:hypothetical protein LNQ81_01565 [Myroides sp. M-43]|uniref:hypothetical protein n=1 Tax=Myroides oncorhynchi TaxID=2893756 RepID=UPI001E53EA60|nr:hypothetical protein [Myroides oncorhynchi]MCC9041407.1 hypothetical protein [Myroides oncorhynchi]